MKISIQEVISNDLKKWGNREFIYTRVENEFIPRSFGETIHDIWALAESLLNLGFENKHILIYGENSYEWVIADLAIMGYVGVTVASNKEWKETDLINMIQIADVECIIYSNTKKDVIETIRKEIDIEYISMQDDIPTLLKQGYELLDKKENKDQFKERNIEELCKIVFTSGTTSTSKAVMLSGKNLFAGFDSLSRRAPMGEEDKVYLFLPLNHTYGGIYNLLTCLYFGMELYLCSDTDKIFEELQMTTPTIFCAVPLIYERVYAMLGDDVIGEIQTNHNEQYIQKVKGMFGGYIKYLFCGGAKYSSEIRKFYKDAGFAMLEAYALTETASSLSIEYANSKSTQSVGTIFEDIEVKFVDVDENGHGEILVKGDNIALGYYNNEKETKKAFDEEGYFHTGDIGYKDEQDQLFLMGRKRRVIVFSNGETIYPDEIEELFKEKEGINKITVYENDGKLAARIYAKSEEIEISKIVCEVNDILPKYKNIAHYEIIIDSINARIK